MEYGNGYSLSDIRAATAGENDWGMQGGWIWWILVLFFLCGNNGFGGCGNNNTAAWEGAATRSAINEGFNFNQLDNGIRGLERGLCSLGYETAQNVNGLGQRMSECCCETNRNIDSVKFENAQNTCAITTAIHEESEKTRALITDNEIQTLRDNLQSAQLQLGNIAQTQTILNSIGCYRPYQSNNYGPGYYAPGYYATPNYYA